VDVFCKLIGVPEQALSILKVKLGLGRSIEIATNVSPIIVGEGLTLLTLILYEFEEVEPSGINIFDVSVEKDEAIITGLAKEPELDDNST
jgi:hypothetical protein